MRPGATLIFETDNFNVITLDTPHLSRADGGHIIIDPKVAVEDRTKLSLDLAKELMLLTMIVGEAMKTGLGKNGINIGRINYQDNGNWKPELHLHLYGRAKEATHQKYGWALRFPLTAEDFKQEMGQLEPLTTQDIKDIRLEIERLLETSKYKDSLSVTKS